MTLEDDGWHVNKRYWEGNSLLIKYRRNRRRRTLRSDQPGPPSLRPGSLGYPGLAGSAHRGKSARAYSDGSLGIEGEDLPSQWDPVTGKVKIDDGMSKWSPSMWEKVSKVSMNKAIVESFGSMEEFDEMINDMAEYGVGKNTTEMDSSCQYSDYEKKSESEKNKDPCWWFWDGPKEELMKRWNNGGSEVVGAEWWEDDVNDLNGAVSDETDLRGACALQGSQRGCLMMILSKRAYPKMIEIIEKLKALGKGLWKASAGSWKGVSKMFGNKGKRIDGDKKMSTGELMNAAPKGKNLKKGIGKVFSAFGVLNCPPGISKKFPTDLATWKSEFEDTIQDLEDINGDEDVGGYGKSDRSDLLKVATFAQRIAIGLGEGVWCLVFSTVLPGPNVRSAKQRKWASDAKHANGKEAIKNGDGAWAAMGGTKRTPPPDYMREVRRRKGTPPPGMARRRGHGLYPAASRRLEETQKTIAGSDMPARRMGALPIELCVQVKFGSVSGQWFVSLYVEFCGNLVQLIGIPPPIMMEVCVGGFIQLGFYRTCPSVSFTLGGNAFFSIAVGIHVWVFELNIYEIELNIGGEMTYEENEIKCWSVEGDAIPHVLDHGWWARSPSCEFGPYSRRRRDTRRRRFEWCVTKLQCDVLVTASLAITLLIFSKIEIQVQFKVSSMWLKITFSAYYWFFFKWITACTIPIYTQCFSKQEIGEDWDGEIGVSNKEFVYGAAATWIEGTAKRQREDHDLHPINGKLLWKGSKNEMTWDGYACSMGKFGGGEPKSEEDQLDCYNKPATKEWSHQVSTGKNGDGGSTFRRNYRNGVVLDNDLTGSRMIGFRPYAPNNDEVWPGAKVNEYKGIENNLREMWGGEVFYGERNHDFGPEGKKYYKGGKELNLKTMVWEGEIEGYWQGGRKATIPVWRPPSKQGYWKRGSGSGPGGRIVWKADWGMKEVELTTYEKKHKDVDQRRRSIHDKSARRRLSYFANRRRRRSTKEKVWTWEDKNEGLSQMAPGILNGKWDGEFVWNGEYANGPLNNYQRGYWGDGVNQAPIGEESAMMGAGGESVEQPPLVDPPIELDEEDLPDCELEQDQADVDACLKANAQSTRIQKTSTLTETEILAAVRTDVAITSGDRLDISMDMCYSGAVWANCNSDVEAVYARKKVVAYLERAKGWSNRNGMGHNAMMRGEVRKGKWKRESQWLEDWFGIGNEDERKENYGRWNYAPFDVTRSPLWTWGSRTTSSKWYREKGEGVGSWSAAGVYEFQEGPEVVKVHAAWGSWSAAGECGAIANGNVPWEAPRWSSEHIWIANGTGGFDCDDEKARGGNKYAYMDYTTIPENDYWKTKCKQEVEEVRQWNGQEWESQLQMKAYSWMEKKQLGLIGSPADRRRRRRKMLLRQERAAGGEFGWWEGRWEEQEAVTLDWTVPCGRDVRTFMVKAGFACWDPQLGSRVANTEECQKTWWKVDGWTIIKRPDEHKIACKSMVEAFGKYEPHATSNDVFDDGGWLLSEGLIVKGTTDKVRPSDCSDYTFSHILHMAAPNNHQKVDSDSDSDISKCMKWLDCKRAMELFSPGSDTRANGYDFETMKPAFDFDETEVKQCSKNACREERHKTLAKRAQEREGIRKMFCTPGDWIEKGKWHLWGVPQTEDNKAKCNSRKGYNNCENWQYPWKTWTFIDGGPQVADFVPRDEVETCRWLWEDSVGEQRRKNCMRTGTCSEKWQFKGTCIQKTETGGLLAAWKREWGTATWRHRQHVEGSATFLASKGGLPNRWTGKISYLGKKRPSGCFNFHPLDDADVSGWNFNDDESHRKDHRRRGTQTTKNDLNQWKPPKEP